MPAAVRQEEVIYFFYKCTVRREVYPKSQIWTEMLYAEKRHQVHALLADRFTKNELDCINI